MGINYVGGHGYNQAEFDPCCPVDKMVLAYGDGKEPTTLFQIDNVEGKAKSEENMHQCFIAVLCSLILKKIRLESKFSRVLDSRAQITGQKYPRAEALFQVERSIRALKTLSGIKGGEEVEKECELAMAKKKEDKEKKKMEELEKGIALPEKKKVKVMLPKKADETRPDYEPEDKIDDFKGWENLPKLCMKIVTENPYLFDSLKCEVLRWEFRQKDTKKAYKKEKYMGPLAGLVGELVRSGQASAREGEKLWLSGILGPHDIQGLLEMHRKEDRNLQDKKKEEPEKPEKENMDAGAEGDPA